MVFTPRFGNYLEPISLRDVTALHHCLVDVEEGIRIFVAGDM
jgi:hypothetical protein